jgi:hypothetical protein
MSLKTSLFVTSIALFSAVGTWSLMGSNHAKLAALDLEAGITAASSLSVETNDVGMSLDRRHIQVGRLTIGGSGKWSEAPILVLEGIDIRIRPEDSKNDRLVISEIRATRARLSYRGDLRANSVDAMLEAVTRHAHGIAGKGDRRIVIESLSVASFDIDIRHDVLGGKSLVTGLPGLTFGSLRQRGEGVTSGEAVRRVAAQIHVEATQAVQREIHRVLAQGQSNPIPSPIRSVEKDSRGRSLSLR